MSRIRLLPAVAVAGSALLALKGLGLVTSGHFALDAITPAAAQHAEAPAHDEPADANGGPENDALWKEVAAGHQQPPADTHDAPAGHDETAADGHGAAADGHGAPAADGHGAPAADAHGAPAGHGEPGLAINGSNVRPNDVTSLTEGSQGERQIIEDLAARRRTLEARAAELDQREVLLQATEARIEQRIAELRSLQGEIQAAADAREEAQNAQIQGVVTMYETMRARDAAAIFNGMDVPVLVDLAGRIKPKKLAEIVAAMSPPAAQRLTVELASRSTKPALPDVSALPKIGSDVGKPD